MISRHAEERPAFGIATAASEEHALAAHSSVVTSRAHLERSLIFSAQSAAPGEPWFVRRATGPIVVGKSSRPLAKESG